MIKTYSFAKTALPKRLKEFLMNAENMIFGRLNRNILPSAKTFALRFKINFWCIFHFRKFYFAVFKIYTRVPLSIPYKTQFEINIEIDKGWCFMKAVVRKAIIDNLSRFRRIYHRHFNNLLVRFALGERTYGPYVAL